MSALDWLLLGGIAMALLWAAAVCIRNQKKGKRCTGDCANCGCSCGK